jgi:hypothetical protein
MLFWIVDNATYFLIILAIVAAGFGTAWWQTRKRYWAIGGGVTVALMALVFILSLVVVTDEKQIRLNIEAMRDAINAGKAEEAAKYFDDEVEVVTANGSVKLPNNILEKMAKSNMVQYGVRKVDTGSVGFDKLSRPNAEVSFMVWAEEDPGKRGLCKMELVRTPQGQWRVRKFNVEAAIGGAKIGPVLFFGGNFKIP